MTLDSFSKAHTATATVHHYRDRLVCTLICPNVAVVPTASEHVAPLGDLGAIRTHALMRCGSSKRCDTRAAKSLIRHRVHRQLSAASLHDAMTCRVVLHFHFPSHARRAAAAVLAMTVNEF